MRSSLLGLLLFLAVGACYSLPSGGSSSALPITRAELDELPICDAREAIDRLRPSWLLPHPSADPLHLGELFEEAQVTAGLVVDGTPPRGLSFLDGMDIRGIEEIRFIPSTEAITRYGRSGRGGMIKVLSLTGRKLELK
jgi:hypothetical protein